MAKDKVASLVNVFRPWECKNPDDSRSWSITVEPAEAAYLAKLVVAERRWLKWSGRVFVFGKHAGIALCSFIVAFAVWQAIGGALSIHTIIVLLFAMIVLLPTIIVNAHRRKNYLSSATGKIARVPLTRLAVQDRLGHFEVVVSDADILSLSGPWNKWVVLAVKLFVMPAVFGGAVWIAISIIKGQHIFNQRGIMSLLGYIGAVFLLLKWANGQTVVGLISTRDSSKCSSVLRVATASMTRGIQTCVIDLDEAVFEIDRYGICCHCGDGRRVVLMPLPPGPLGLWHAARIVSAIQQIHDPSMEKMIPTKIDGHFVPLAAWPVVDRAELESFAG